MYISHYTCLDLFPFCHLIISLTPPGQRSGNSASKYIKLKCVCVGEQNICYKAEIVIRACYLKQSDQKNI